MRKRIPFFSALAVVYAVFDLVKIIKNMIHTFSVSSGLLPIPGVSISSLLPDLVHVGLVIVLAVLAVLVVSKPEYSKAAGWIALVWSGWGCFSLVRSLLFIFHNGFENSAVLSSVCSAIPNAIVLVVWLIVSISMVTGKKVKKAPLSLTHLTIMGAVMALVSAIPPIFEGNQNVASLMISGILSALPMLAMYAAGWLLQEAFAAPDQAPVLTGTLVKQTAVFVVIAAIAMALFYACEKPKDDGKEWGICPNCHSRMETKYISRGQCTRCDGRDWYN